jgi:transposase
MHCVSLRRLRHCREARRSIFVLPKVDSFIPKSFAGNTLLTQLIAGKYIDHLPTANWRSSKGKA